MNKKSNWKARLYLAPTLILIGIFMIYPLINTFYTSFLKDYEYGSGYYDGFTFDNYKVILGIQDFPETMAGAGQTNAFLSNALPNTLLIALITVPISIFLSLIIATLINSIKWFQKFFQTLFFMPYVTNMIAVGMVFSVIFSKNGLFNYVFNLGETLWINQSADLSYFNAMFALCIEIIWYQMPYKILIFLSGLQGIDKQYYQSAKIDGTPKRKVFTKIIVPMLSPQILYISITSLIGAFKEYQSVVGLFGEGVRGTSYLNYNLYTCVYYIYDMVESGQNTIQYASAAAVILFLIILVFTLIELWISKKKVQY